MLLLLTCAAAAAQQPPAAPPADQGAAAATRPPADNDRTLRQLSPDEIPPNLSFYAVDPLYTPGAPLGWADRRLDERLDRGVVVRAAGDGRVHVSWRLLADDPDGVAFHVWRADSDGAAGTRRTRQPIRSTTDFLDSDVSAAGGQVWWVTPIVGGREQPASPRAALPASAPTQPYSALKLKDDVRSVDRVGSVI